MPPRTQLAGFAPLANAVTPVAFGTPSTPGMANTTLKAKDKIGIRVYAGDSDVTADFRIRVYGVLYSTDAELREAFGSTVYGHRGREGVIVDMSRGRRLPFAKDEVSVSIKNFDKFVGGMKQDKPIVMPFFRYAYNAKPTTANVEYEFNYEAGEVDASEQALYFDFEKDEALLIKHLGVKTVEHLKYLGVKLGDHSYPKPNMFRVDAPSNPFNFGHAYPLFPSDMPVFLPIPTLVYGYMVNNEKGRVIVMDDGTSIAANGIVAALGGIRVSL